MPIELLRGGGARYVPAAGGNAVDQANAHWSRWPDLWRQVGGREKDLQRVAASALRPLFSIREEVRGEFVDPLTGERRNLRVDMIIDPLPSSGLRLGPMAVEFKHPSTGRAIKGLGDHIRQAWDYRFTAWDGYGRLPVLMCPGWPRKDFIPHSTGHWFGNRSIEDLHAEHAVRVLGSLGVGELFVNPLTVKATLVFTADTLIDSGIVTRAGYLRQKCGHGIGSAAK